VEDVPTEKQLDLIPPPTPPPPPPLPGIEWIELQRRFTETRQELAPALDDFRSSHRPTLALLREHLAERRTDDLRRLAHDWADAAGNLSANELRRRAKTLELSLKFNQGDPSRLLEELEAEAAKVLDGIDVFLAGPTTGAAVDPTPSDPRPLPPEPTPETPTNPHPDRPETDDPPRSHT
jgi:HPt (histidine-containing phosphotransfer) domain-containing protein